MKKSLRKGAIVKYIGNDKSFIETWGNTFEVYRKEGEFLKVSSVLKPMYGVIAVIPCKQFRIV